MTARPLFDAALAAVRDWHAAMPEACAFCRWPEDVAWAGRPARGLPAGELMIRDPGTSSAVSAPLLASLQAIAPHVEWRQSYTEQEVGPNFLDRYGWFELAGPMGHFLTNLARITVGYWGPGLFYPRHQHAAGEIYTVVSGRAVFHSDGEADAELGPGMTRRHAPHQPHAITTTDTPILTVVFWAGDGLADQPRISRS